MRHDSKRLVPQSMAVPMAGPSAWTLMANCLAASSSREALEAKLFASGHASMCSREGGQLRARFLLNHVISASCAAEHDRHVIHVAKSSS